MNDNEKPIEVLAREYHDKIIEQNPSAEAYNISGAYIAGAEKEKSIMKEKALTWYCRDCSCNDHCAADHKCVFRTYFEDYLDGNDSCVMPKTDYDRKQFGRIKSKMIDDTEYFLRENLIPFLNIKDCALVQSAIDNHVEHFITHFKNYMKKRYELDED